MPDIMENSAELKKQNQLLEVWKSLKKNRLAVFGLCLTIFEEGSYICQQTVSCFKVLATGQLRFLRRAP